MSSIPLPALGIHPVQSEDPLAAYGKVASLQGMLQQRQSQALQLQQQQQALTDQKAMTAAMQQYDPSHPEQLPKLVLQNHGSANAAALAEQHVQTIQKTAADIAKDQSETGKNNAETQQKNFDVISGRLQSVIDTDDQHRPQEIINAAKDLSDQKLIDPQHAQTAAQIAQLPSDQQKHALVTLQKTYQTLSSQLTQQKDQADLAAKSAQLPGQVAESQQKALTLAGTSPTGVTADQQATLAQGNKRIGLEAQNVALSRGRLSEEVRHNQATEGQLTPDALEMGARSFATTGQMPQVGRSGAVRAQIMNKASEMYPTLDPVANAAEYKANSDSLKKLQGNLDAVSAFETTAGKNLKLFTDQAKNVIDTGSPFLNAPLRMLAKNVFGSENQAAVDTARQVAVNEIAKVTSSPGLSGQLSDSARHEVDNFNPQNATLNQTFRVAQILQQDMQNRHESYDQQISQIKQRLQLGPDGKPNNPSPSLSSAAPDKLKSKGAKYGVEF